MEFKSNSRQTHKETPPFVPRLAREAKAIVALAFRNGPIEDIHAGKVCPMCADNPDYSHISDAEMKRIMKSAVDRVYELLLQKETDPQAYEATLRHGDLYTRKWDEPEQQPPTKTARGVRKP
ncbi:MAG: hypothetical protein L0Z50_05945 [Verrucomicrobiales bacterium]|nr:hypothetical protein [Verrucomicrobiales bacterium]